MSKTTRKKKPIKNSVPKPFHEFDPTKERKTIDVLQKEYNNVFLIRCPYCLGTGKFPYGMGICTPCQGHAVIDSRTFKYPVKQDNPVEKKVN